MPFLPFYNSDSVSIQVFLNSKLIYFIYITEAVTVKMINREPALIFIRGEMGTTPSFLQVFQSSSIKLFPIDNCQNSGYIIAKMKYDIILSPEAIEDMKQLNAHDRAKIKKTIEVHLRHEPTKGSKSRIKRLRGLRRPQYRLRVDEIRVFYDVEEKRVEILAIISKSKAIDWLERAGEGI